MKIKFSHRGLHRTSEDERTVKTAHLKPDCRNGSYPAEVFCRTGTQRISSWPGDTPPKNRPDTLTQTFFIHQLFPCSQTADHTFRQVRPEQVSVVAPAIAIYSWNGGFIWFRQV